MAKTTTLPPSRRLAKLTKNPVTIKELRSRMRGSRAFLVLTLYLVLMSGVITLVYLGYTSSVSVPGSTSAYTAGKGFFAAVLGVQVMLVTLIGPIFTASAISGEKDRQTFDLLRTTLLSAESLVLGKLVSALGYIFLLVLVSIPLQSIAFLLGGLSPVELVLSQVLVLVAAVTYALYGLWCSATMRSTLAATVATFAGTIFVTIGIPIFAFMSVFLFGTILFSSSPIEPLVEISLIYIGLALAATNLPATLILSETFLLNQNTLLGYTHTISGHTMWVFSPWTLFIIIHVLAALFFYVKTTRRVRRIGDT